MKLIAGIIFFGVIACAGNGNGSIFNGSELPENPEHIVIRWYSGGGMLPEGEDIHISEDSCVWTQWQNQSERRLKFTMTPEEIRDLYQVFIDNDFDRIDVLEEQEVYDRGGTSIDVNVDGRYFNKSNSGMSFVKEGSWDEYAAVENAICNIAQEKTKDMRADVAIQFTDALVNSGLIIHFSVNDEFFYSSDEDGKQSTFTHPVYFGENQFTVTLSDPDSLNSYGYPVTLMTKWLVEDISGPGQTMVIDYDEQKVFVKQ